MRTPKRFIGQNLRRIRLGKNMKQGDFAASLGISTSYLSQLETNQRHVTAPILMALAEKFSVNIAELSKNESDRLMADMIEVFADSSISADAPSRQEIELVSHNAPSVAHALINLHRERRKTVEVAMEKGYAATSIATTPYEEVRDFFHYQNNYVDELDRAAEHLNETLKTSDLYQSLTQYIKTAHGVRIAHTTDNTTHNIRKYDPETKVLLLNPVQPRSGQLFQIAHQIALLEHSGTIDRLVREATFSSTDASAVCRMSLANYFAGAIILPYTVFLDAAHKVRHDIDILSDQFGASLEQVAHRLSTLQRPGFVGTPFFFARVDQAGNITKRHSAAKLQFARFGSACPLWNVHRAFETPSRIIRQLAETPDGERYLCLAIAITKRSGGFKDPVARYALALGCDIRHGGSIVYADDLPTSDARAFEPIGVSCRLCERENCHQRSIPPVNRQMLVDPNQRGVVPYVLGASAGNK